MITDAMICTIGVFDSEGEESLSILHTVSETVLVKQYGSTVLDLNYDEAMALHRALSVMVTQSEFDPIKTP